MKNFGVLLLGIILGALAMYFYCCNTDAEMTSEPPRDKPAGLISPKDAMAMDAAYDIKYRIINDSLFKGSKTGDNRSSWWSVENIQNYIFYADNQAGEKGYVMDGLRLYLAAYPGKDGETGITTMFFVPTGYKDPGTGNPPPLTDGSGSNDIGGVDPLNMGNEGDPPGSNYPN